MKHVVSISDLSKKQILSILKRAKELVPVAKGKKKSKSLDGKILATGGIHEIEFFSKFFAGMNQGLFLDKNTN